MVDFRSLVPWREKSQSPTRGDVPDVFLNFRREMDRMFESFFDGFGGPAGRDWALPTPALDVAETEKELIVSAELPGVSEKDVEVTLVGDVLTVEGSKKAEHEKKDGDLWYAERRFGSFSRSMRLPFEVTEENVDANFDKGVLTVRIPKPADSQKSVRRIEVNSA
jgi:HSP20 family protein